MIEMVELGSRPVLVIIDVQEAWKGLFEGKWSSDNAVQNMSRLLQKWRSMGWKVIHVRHDSRNENSRLKQGKPGFEFQKEVMPEGGEQVITKHVNSAFIGTDLEEVLRSYGADRVVICGLVTDHCISTTARMSGNLGFNTIVVGDACAAYPKTGPDGKEIDSRTVHIVNLASINGEFAEVVDTEDLF